MRWAFGKIEAALCWYGAKYIAAGMLAGSFGFQWWQFLLTAIVLVGYDKEPRP